MFAYSATVVFGALRVNSICEKVLLFNNGELTIVILLCMVSVLITLVLRDPYRSGFAMHVCVAGYGSIRDRPVSSFTL